MVGVGQAQSAQLNLLNPGLANTALGVICTAGVSFIDAAGAVLKPELSHTRVVPSIAAAAQ
jgi:hypothetical protein